MEKLISELRASGVLFDKGLSNTEIAEVEETYGFSFPEDLKEFLMLGLPVGFEKPSTADFPIWRDTSSQLNARLLSWPSDQIRFDVEQNDFWLDSLGPKPVETDKQVEMLINAVKNAPKLIPIFGHRYMCESPKTRGNPILSFWQPTDVIYYGADLEAYLRMEFLGSNVNRIPKESTAVPFWGEFLL